MHSLTQPQRKWGTACRVSQARCRPALAPRTEALDLKCQLWLHHVLGVRQPASYLASVSLGFLLYNTANSSVCLLTRLRYTCKVLLIRLWELFSSQLQGAGQVAQPVPNPQTHFSRRQALCSASFWKLRKLTFQKKLF